MKSYKSKKAILFDFGDTLASTIPTYPERIRIAMEKAGFELSYEEYMNAYMKADYETFRRYIKLKHVDNKMRMNCLFEIVTSETGLEADPDQILKSVVENMKKEGSRERVLLKNALELLRSMKKRGFILAIVSNNDGRVANKCEELGIREYFDLIVDSGNIGFIKPGKEIFDHTLKHLGLERSEVLHVGDLYGADILGANNAGIEAVWFNNKNSNDFENTGVVQIEDLSELQDIVL